MLENIEFPEDYLKWETTSLLEFLDFNLNKKRVVETEKGEVSIEEDDVIFTDSMKQAFIDNKITGLVFTELNLDDLKELLATEPQNAQTKRVLIYLKMIINKMSEQHTSSLLIDNLSNMHQVLNNKFLDYQAQYNKLRIDVLEIIKTTNNTPPTLQYNNSSENINSSSDQSQPTLVQKSSTFSLGKAFTNTNPNKPEQNSQNEQVSEPLKQLRASKEDSCEKVLINAMKKHNLEDQDWRSYVLVICYGDQERILNHDEKPVTIFKNLKKNGLHPAIMLRQKDDSQLDSNTPGGRL